MVWRLPLEGSAETLQTLVTARREQLLRSSGFWGTPGQFCSSSCLRGQVVTRISEEQLLETTSSRDLELDAGGCYRKQLAGAELWKPCYSKVTVCLCHSTELPFWRMRMTTYSRISIFRQETR